MPQPERYVRVKIECSARHEHEICVEIPRQVPPELRCTPDAPRGYSQGGSGASCSILPATELVAVTARELRDNFQESKRRGYVLIRR